ncbi:P-loop NTPase [Muricoccus aerilatus]|uniref:P-loop NTPase n=1 Tax=Muricoccus aerilatus TaxID=452982 RepID=UPI0005C18EBC|nr:P-loop NTPase [Roseomonas aerilata]
MSEPRPQPPRSHLIDRAIDAMGGLDALSSPRLPAARGPIGEPPATQPAPAPVPPTPGPGAGETPAPATGVSASRPLPAGPLPAPAGQGTPVLDPPVGRTPDTIQPPSVPLAALLSAGLVATPGKGRSRSSEEVSVVQHQVLRTMLAAPSADARSRVVLVTSARPGEGKTFLALNIAASLAAGGSHPVVLVDADGKVDSLSQLLGLTERPGLRLLAAEGGRNARAMVVPTAMPRLSVMPYGVAQAKGPAVPPGAALAAAVRQTSAALPGHIIVIDSPPALSTSDAGTLASVSGQVLVVVEAERTQRSEVEAALDLVEACPVLQLVLNKARFSESDTFGTYSNAYGGDSK